MLYNIISAATVLLAIPALSSPVVVKVTPEAGMLNKRIDDCSNYHPMVRCPTLLSEHPPVSILFLEKLFRLSSTC